MEQSLPRKNASLNDSKTIFIGGIIYLLFPEAWSFFPATKKSVSSTHICMCTTALHGVTTRKEALVLILPSSGLVFPPNCCLLLLPVLRNRVGQTGVCSNPNSVPQYLGAVLIRTDQGEDYLSHWSSVAAVGLFRSTSPPLSQQVQVGSMRAQAG